MLEMQRRIASGHPSQYSLAVGRLEQSMDFSVADRAEQCQVLSGVVGRVPIQVMHVNAHQRVLLRLLYVLAVATGFAGTLLVFPELNSGIAVGLFQIPSAGLFVILLIAGFAGFLLSSLGVYFFSVSRAVVDAIFDWQVTPLADALGHSRAQTCYRSLSRILCTRFAISTLPIIRKFGAAAYAQTKRFTLVLKRGVWMNAKNSGSCTTASMFFNGSKNFGFGVGNATGHFTAPNRKVMDS